MEMNMDTIGTSLLDMAHQYALQAVKDSKWFRTAPAEFHERGPEIRLTGFEQHEVFRSIGGVRSGSYLAPFIVGETTVGGITAKFRFRAEFGAGGLVIEEQ